MITERLPKTYVYDSFGKEVNLYKMYDNLLHSFGGYYDKGKADWGKDLFRCTGREDLYYQ